MKTSRLGEPHNINATDQTESPRRDREGAGRKRVYATQAEKVHEYRKRMKRVAVYTKSSS